MRQALRQVIGNLPGARRKAVEAVCRLHGVRSLGLFGSILAEDFDSVSSDVDVVVSFGPPVAESLARQYFDLKDDLEKIWGRTVDLVEIEAMPDTRLKRLIERTKITIYGA